MVDSVIIQTRPADPLIQANLERAGLPTLLARLLAARGVTSITEINYQWQRLIPPAALSNNQTTAQLLADAIAQKKRLLIVADYDCDGATACAVALRGLRMFGAEVDFVVPNRFETGYGLSPEVIDLIMSRDAPKPDLIITVDNGIASIEGIKYANQLGMQVIVTDHHLPTDELPAALSIINPNQKGCNFPSKNLAGVGVIFYLLLALRAEFRLRGAYTQHPEPRLDVLSDLLAIGTVADVVKLDNNNRILVAQGLNRIRKGQVQAGVNALFEVAGSPWQEANAMDLGFKIGPRINAAGRLADMSIGIRCLTTDDPVEATKLAKELDAMNHKRRHIEQIMNKDALDSLARADMQDKVSLCVYDAAWHPGVVGIVASRLKEKFWKPVFAFAPSDEGEIRGSGRSVPDMHLRDALYLVSKRHPDMILKFGGHAMAAGLTIVEDKLESFNQALDEAIFSMLGKTNFKPVLETDGSLPLDLITIDNAQLIKEQIWGAGFPAPSFHDIFKIRQQRILNDKHLKLQLEKDQHLFDAIWFNHNQSLPEYVQIVYELDVNRWNGMSKVQFIVRHAQQL